MKKLDFGDYCLIEQKRYGAKNEMYLHKVIGSLKSNTYVDVPVKTPATEIVHETIVNVVRCITVGVSETEVRKYRAVDCKATFHPAILHINCSKNIDEKTIKAINRMVECAIKNIK